MESIHITEVALRDGLQNQAVHLSTTDKLELVHLLVEAGVQSIEATSFVSPKAVPQMADADAFLPAISATHPALRISVLVPNQRGLQRAIAAGAREIAVVLSATETMNRRNINMGLAQALQVSVETLQAARDAGLRTRAYLAVAFECPFEGHTPIDVTLNLAESLSHAAADEVVFADTIGAADPKHVRDLLRVTASVLPLERTGVHFHDTRGFGIANAWAALECGVRKFDASVGGLGGCPFAPGAAGNLATEDLVLLAQQTSLDSGIDLEALIHAIDHAQAKLLRSIGGRSSTWLRQRRATQP